MVNENKNKAVEIHAVAEWVGSKRIIFKVPIPHRQPVYMSILIGYLSCENSVVVVDAAKFLQLWRNNRHSLHSEVAEGNPETWVNDYKYHYAETGFATGASNPVPLADVSCWMDNHPPTSYKSLWPNKHPRQIPCVGFTNGVTRTIWLLANGCTSFPIRCSEPGATTLQNIVGANEWPRKITGEDVGLIMANYPSYPLYT